MNVEMIDLVVKIVLIILAAWLYLGAVWAVIFFYKTSHTKKKTRIDLYIMLIFNYMVKIVEKGERIFKGD